ncbi:MAG: LCP family protein [Clostridia bacterium]|nr:LCP family protein [Clostridia bacterium]
MDKEKKKSKKKLVILLCLLIPFVLVIGTLAGVFLPIIISYNKNAYQEVDIVERSDEYVMPEQDSQPAEWADVTLSDDEVGRDLTATLPNDINQGGNSGEKADDGRNASLANTPNAISVYGRTPIYKVAKKDPNIENILVIGTDTRYVTKERGRSDAMIIVSYNRKTGSIKMTSILRDSLVPIEGHGWNRINAAYSFDGVGLAINTVNEIFDLDIQRFVVVDFYAVTHFIDKVGGLNINLTKKEAEYLWNKTDGKGYQYHEGENFMNGDRCLEYMRIRKIDSDFYRSGRQRKVIELLANKIIKEKNIAEIYELTEFGFSLVKTNIPFGELSSVVGSVATKAAGRSISIDSQTVPYPDASVNKYYNGMAIKSFDIDDAARRINKFIYG